MESDDAPTHVPILGKETIVVHHDLWGTYIVEDLLQNVTATTYVLVTDDHLRPPYVPAFQEAFERVVEQRGLDATLYVRTVPPGESSKTRRTKDRLQDWMLSGKLDPPCDTKTVMIALGGGVIGDMIGYTASDFKRGVRYVQVPTSLLSMVDSSIGGKTAVNTPAGKNLIGAFWQPTRIYIDLNFLATLPTRDFINGMAEIIKTAAIWSETNFAFLERHVDQLMAAIALPPGPSRLDGVQSVLKEAILGSVRTKTEVVTLDEREGGLRNLLNFGHSIGHAYEGLLAPQILHGECVSIGMVLEAQLARYLGVLKSSAVARLTKCLAAYSLPLSVTDPIVQQRSGRKKCSVSDLLTVMAVDKKNVGRKKRIVLLAGIGRTYEKQATAVSDRDIKVILSPAIEVHPSKVKNDRIVCIPPGSKSISNRALVLAALGKGEVRLHNLLHSDDTEVMLSALADMRCATFEWEADGSILVVRGNGGLLQPSSKEIYLGNAGTASRFLTTVATLVTPSEDHDASVLTGNKRMRERPIGPLVDALRSNGAEIDFVEQTGSLPLRIKASGGLEGGVIELAATVSSQYVSSILMCAPYAKKAVTLRLIGGKPISQPYIDMTTAMMKAFGIQVTKSTSEDHTYHIAQGHYQNPSDYVIESDASSATYPLALAAITGTTCTVPNIGSSSLQGDARFAVSVLRPMGCVVEQSDTSTTVSGPPSGTLKPLPEVDMEPMTDAFLTACVLAAVASSNNDANTTRIFGIANQRVKECDRIQAMHDQLAKFGVTSRESADGIEVDGTSLANLKAAQGGVECYDDHRVAMSFSVLAFAAPHATLIRERECVGKTWPGWWDELLQNFGAHLEGIDIQRAHQVAANDDRSIFLIGMRGAGKSTAAIWASRILGWPSQDLDKVLEQKVGCSIRECIDQKGWDHFRSEELVVFKKALKEHPRRHIFACGGGIVETPEARKLLVQYQQQGGPVLFVHRNLDSIVEYLQKDQSRPGFVENTRQVWRRREQWYNECSNYEHLSQTDTTGGFVEASKDFEHLLLTIAGRSDAFEKIQAKGSSFFVSLTSPAVSTVLDFLPDIVVGSDALELRVDLLQDQDQALPSRAFVARQISTIRAAVSCPIIFTVRTQSQGGQFPDDQIKVIVSLNRLALRMGVEFLDLEMTLPDADLQELVRQKGNTKVIASQHDPQGALRWDDGSWISYYNRALLYGDIIKLIGVARTEQDDQDVYEFRRWAEDAHSTPVIALNMGPLGQLSRIQNRFMTPVTHPLLQSKAAPGQLSASDIRRARTLQGRIQPEAFYLFGKPIAASRSPALHNALFTSTGLPHRYARFETDDPAALKPLLSDEAFGGASVTIPLKLDIMPFLDDLSGDARVIGAVNTVVVDRSARSETAAGGYLRTGHNTDWKGIQFVLEQAGARALPALSTATAPTSPDPPASECALHGGKNTTDSTPSSSALVIGGGGTARAAIHALYRMGFAPLWVVGRSPKKLAEMLASFPDNYDLRPLVSAANAQTLRPAPRVAVGTIPADTVIDEEMQEVLKTVMSEVFLPAEDGQSEGNNQVPRVLLDMAYKPRVTPLMAMASRSGWRTIGGLEALAAQGMYQVRFFSTEIFVI